MAPLPPTEAPLPLSDLISQISEYGNGASSSGGGGGGGGASSSPPPLTRDAAQSLSDELLALQAIYAPEEADLKVVGLEEDVKGGKTRSAWSASTPGVKIRLELKLPLDLPRPKGGGNRDEDETPESLRLSISIPASYPMQSVPQLQLLDRFLGPHEVDAGLFGQVLRTLKSGAGADAGTSPPYVVLFEGCESVKEKVEAWYKRKDVERAERQQRDGRGAAGSSVTVTTTEVDDAMASMAVRESRAEYRPPQVPSRIQKLISAKKWTTTEAVVERKSTFIGHAIRLDSSEEVPYLLGGLLSLYPRMVKATHPLMRAWVCSNEKTGVVERDNDDDGESAAGGRLAHLLEMVHCNNALVVVTRYYGGIHLGADRFKLINRVAREALESAHLIPSASGSGGGKNSRK